MRCFSVKAYPSESKGENVTVHDHINLKRHRVVLELLSEVPYSHAPLQRDKTRPHEDHQGLELDREYKLKHSRGSCLDYWLRLWLLRLWWRWHHLLILIRGWLLSLLTKQGIIIEILIK